MTSVADELRRAISLGAPLYNAGDAGGCLRTYTQTALKVADGSTATEGERSTLRDAVQRAAECSSSDEGAWVMRRAFDSILGGAVAARERAAAVAASVGPGGDFEMLSFEKGLMGPRWRVLDDVIMGGRSQSNGVTWDAGEQAAVYSGNVTTDGGGGFASLRSDDWAGFTSLGAARGVRLMCKGDGRVYKLNALTDADYDGVQYQSEFVAPPQWGAVDLPFTGFRPTFRGRPVPNRPPLQGANIRSVGLMVSKFTTAGGTLADFRNGPFRLSIRWMRGFI
ncbi:hypothetical protein HYH03_006181 [Edaphochlamys debaryana]|uniref:NADH:ubiquinone oxidoreductase intermediate-associated protein 30 domain-containing protein n=1 Tax=Edaphochlamys debaryana TaxID=47281 RepID=A0A836C094_9CHLO|nr:hypothetical protein HYH03_006181 [Edaphochlamys debaryana]|eukprot:KAG2495581.1 hypothetical protein HYH03_006181 [Edaphochlamys debaryana]